MLYLHHSNVDLELFTSLWPHCCELSQLVCHDIAFVAYLNLFAVLLFCVECSAVIDAFDLQSLLDSLAVASQLLVAHHLS